MAKNRTPITRVNKFFSFEDFELELSMGREAIEGDGNFTIVLYRVDRELTQTTNLYNETSASELIYKTPIELKVVPTIEEPENELYNESSLRHLEGGNLRFGIYQQQLDELAVELSFGDYIGYPINETKMIYFSVSNDGIKNYDNKHTIMGYKGAFRSVVCVPVNNTEFEG